MLAEDLESEAPVARWIELLDSTSSSSDYLVCASPISGSDKLRQLLWNQASGVILMSVTLTSCGTFDLHFQQSGLSANAAVQFLRCLIRTDEDHGTATILDRRLVSRRRVCLLMRGLPDFELDVEPARGDAASGLRG